MPQRSSASAPLNTFAATAPSNSTVTICFHDNIGREVLVETRSGDRYEGILAAYSADKEIGLACAYKLPSDGEEQFLPKRSEIKTKMRFAPSSYVTMSLLLVEDRNIREFATDADYHDRKVTNGEHLDDFEEWHDDDQGNDELGTIDENGPHTGGWAVQDMFDQNGSKVKSDFREDLSQYTTVEVGDVSEEARRQADRIARDIENSVGSRRNQLLENDDEERDLDKATEFEKDKDYVAPSGRRTGRHQHVRGNTAPPRGGAGSARGRGGRQFNAAQQNQNFANQQFNPRSGGYQGRAVNVGNPRYASDRQQMNGNMMPSAGETWRQPNMNVPARRAGEPVGSYSAVVAAGMKQTSPSASNDVRMSSGNAPANRIVETGASVTEKAHDRHNPGTRNKRTEDLRTWGSTFDKAFNQPEAQMQNVPAPGSAPSSRPGPGNAWQSGPPHRGRNNQTMPSKPEEAVEKKSEKPEDAEDSQTPSTSEAEKPKAEETKKVDAVLPPSDPSPEVPVDTETNATDSSDHASAKSAPTFKFNPNAAVFTPKSVVSQPQQQPQQQQQQQQQAQQPIQQMMPVMPVVMPPPPPPASSAFAPVVVAYNGPQMYQQGGVVYQQGQVYTSMPQPYAVVPPQSQPQPSGTQTPNSSTAGVVNANQQNANSSNPQQQQQQPQRPGSVSRQQSQSAGAPMYAAQFQPGMQQQAYVTYPHQQVYPQAMHIPYHYQPQAGYQMAAGQPTVTSTSGQTFSNVQPQVTQFHVHQQQAAAMPHQQHPGAYGHMQQGAPYHPQNAVESNVPESQTQSTNGSTSSSAGCQRSSKPATPQPVSSQPQQISGSGMTSSATSGYNTPHPGTPQPQQQPPVAQMAPQQPMYPMHGQNAPSIYMYQPGHQIYQIPPHQGQYIQYQQPRNSSFPPQNVMYAQQAPMPQQQPPQQVNMQNS